MSADFQTTVQFDSDIAGTRLDQALAKRLPELSRSQLTKWIKEGTVTIDGQSLKPQHRMRGGEIVAVSGNFNPVQDWQSAADVPLEVVYEDESILVIDKAAGLVVHPGAATTEPTLANGLIAVRPDLSKLARVGIVHRLDKETSGLMVVAKTEYARVNLVAMLGNRLVSRKYLAIVEGCLDEPRDVDLPLGRSSRDRTKQTVRSDGREAQTHFRPLSVYRCHSVLEATLGTGRTHQIRVHAARIGLPLVGDSKYGAKRILPPGASTELQKTLREFPRQALHADKLSFEHPTSRDAMQFESPLPPDIENLLSLLKQDDEALG